MRTHFKGLIGLLLVFVLCTAMFAPAAFADPAGETLKLPVTVELERELSYKNDHQITIEALDDNCPMPDGSADGKYTMTITGADTKEFPDITFTRVGIFNYKVTQKDLQKEGWTFDDSVYTVVVTVTTDGQGNKTMTVALHKEGVDEKPEKVLFTNKYTAKPALVTLTAKKTLDGAAPKDDKFSFELVDAQGVVVDTASSIGGNITFKELSFDDEGTIAYFIREVNTGDANIKYDENVFKAVVKIELKDDYEATVTYLKNEESYNGEMPLFENMSIKPRPNTGDTMKLGLWIAIFAAAAIVFVVLLIKGRKKEDAE